MKKVITWLATLVFTGFCAMMIFGINGKAYIDPSVSSYLIQAIAGIVITVAAVVGLYFRRAKKKVSKKLGIDENRNKEVETDEILKKENECSDD